jgi:hypothetical protein
MSGAVDWKRLIAALTLSVALHYFVLALLTPGLPGVGKPVGATNQTIRLKVSFVTSEQLAASLAGLDPEEQAVPMDTESVVGMPETSVDPIVVETSRIGLPIYEEMGPPFPPPLPTYLPLTALDQAPQPLTELDTHFAALEGRIGAGRMVFSLLIDENGKVDEVLNEYSSLALEFVGIVQEALGEMRFHPGMKDGRPVKSRTRIEVNFSYSIF